MLDLVAEAERFMPGGVNSYRRRCDPPLCFRSARGAYLEDLAGRTYVDYHAAFGAVVLGHSYEPVVDRVVSTIRDVVLIGFGVTELEVELARKVVEHVPSAEMALTCNSGSEATFHAIRLARAATGREKIVKFEGCYNGFHDSVLYNVLTPPEALGRVHPQSAGMLRCAADSVLVCRFNDLEHVERIVRAHSGEVAALVIEPIAHNAPSILPKPGFLAGLRELADREDALLVFDETITGFRHHLGGYQAIAGVNPDLTTLGKAIANGFPVAVVAGRRQLMERFSTRPGGDVHFGGTYNGNAVGVAAALATIECLEDSDVHAHLFRLGARMRAGLEQIATEAGIPAIASGFGSIFCLCFMEGPLECYEDVLRNDAGLFLRYRRELISRGVFEDPLNLGRSHITYSHSDDDIDRSLEVAEAALHTALAGGAPKRSVR